MILIDFECPAKHRFEAGIESMFSDNPPCPECSGPTWRRPAAIRLGKSADAGPSREQMPHSWNGIDRGRADSVRYWREKMEKREKLEEKYPELGGDRRPVLAHEGIFAGRPLRVGDDIGAAVGEAVAGQARQSSIADIENP
jgi:hypothetical protein